MKKSLTSGLMIKGCAAALTGLLLSACSQSLTTASEPRYEATGQAQDGSLPGTTAGPVKPEFAFMIEEGLYAVPLAVDYEGCEQFTTWSESGVKSLAQPIYFHDGKGSFTPTKVEGASCNATMIETGVDAEGCPTFRAKQPDGSSSEVVYYASPHGYTIKKERSSCR